jgi:uroporphyrinogen-III synthase
MTIWLTRTQAQSESMAQAMQQPALIAPLTRVVHHHPQIDGVYDAIITTSPHGATGIAQYHHLPLYTVGEASATAAREAGFSNVHVLAEDATHLVAALAERHPSPTRFLYLSGKETRIDIAALLRGRGHEITTSITYEIIPETVLPASVGAQWNSITGIVLMSVGAVKAAQQLITKDVSHIHAYCISATVAAAAGALPWASLQVSERPTQQSLIELINTTIRA